MLFHYFDGEPFSNPITTLLAHGYLQVDLFFVLSGFVMALNYASPFRTGWRCDSFVRFLGRRIARIYPLYAATTLIGLGLIFIHLERPPALASFPVALAANFAMIQSWGIAGSINPPAWSISTEWAAYLLFPLLLSGTVFAPRRIVLGSTVAAIALLCVLALLPAGFAHKSKPNAYLDIFNALHCLPVLRCLAEFTLGLLAFRGAPTRFGRALARAPSAAWLLSIVIVVLFCIPGTDLAIVLLLPPLILSLTGAPRGVGSLLSSAPVELLGRLSYGIYLTHQLMAGLIEHLHVFFHARGVHHAQTYAAAIAICLTFPAAYAVYRWIEVPGRRSLRLLFEPGQRVPRIAAEPSAP